MKKTLFNSNQCSRQVNVILNSYDYDKYENLPGQNRKVNESHVKRLMESFSFFGTSSVKITIVRTKSVNGKVQHFVADGQHTIVAASRLGLPLSIFIVELFEDTLLNVTKYIAILNNNAKAWSTKNYLKAYSSNKIFEYLYYEDVMEKTGLTITDLCFIFTGSGGYKQTRAFKNGELVFPDIKESNRLLKSVIKVLPYIPKKSFTRRSLYKVLRMTKEYDRMADAIIKTSKLLSDACMSFSENETDFHNHLIKIYKSEFKIKD